MYNGSSFADTGQQHVAVAIKILGPSKLWTVFKATPDENANDNYIAHRVVTQVLGLQFEGHSKEQACNGTAMGHVVDKAGHINLQWCREGQESRVISTRFVVSKALDRSYDVVLRDVSNLSDYKPSVTIRQEPSQFWRMVRRWCCT